MENIRGLITLSPTIGGPHDGIARDPGMPPFGVFASEFLILTTAMREQPWATPILLTALGVAFALFSAACNPWCLVRRPGSACLTRPRCCLSSPTLPLFSCWGSTCRLTSRTGIARRRVSSEVSEVPLRVWSALSELQPGAPGLRALTVSEDQWRRLRRTWPPRAGGSWRSGPAVKTSARCRPFTRRLWPILADSC